MENGILQNACSTSPKGDAGLVKSALMRIARLMNSLAKGFKKNGDKSAVAMLKITRQLGCVFQDMEPPKSSSILRKSSNILKPIRCIRFTKAVVRHANIRDWIPTLCPKFEVRSKEETEWQEPCAREAAWTLAKNILKLEDINKTAFFSPSENWRLPAPSTL